MTTPALALRDIRAGWTARTVVLEVPELVVETGESLFLAGPSGCGKSTLLSVVAGMLTPSAGQVLVLGEDLLALSVRKRDRFRADHLGVVFQQFNLLPWLSLLHNVLLPCRFSVRRRQRAIDADGSVENQARRLLAGLGLSAASLLARPVASLSVGQQQRVAVARALIGHPPVLLADEPTSALDARRSEEFVVLLTRQCRLAGTTLVFVSHDERLAGAFDRRLCLATLNRAPAEEI